jgi:hypothetical protein
VLQLRDIESGNPPCNVSGRKDLLTVAEIPHVAERNDHRVDQLVVVVAGSAAARG